MGSHTRCFSMTYELGSTRRPGPMDRTRDDSSGGGTGSSGTDRGVDPLTPETTEAPALAPAATVAGGIPAIVSTLRYAVGETGLYRAGRLLLDLNQTQGFDC